MNPKKGEKLREILRQRAEKLGFDAFGITRAAARPDLKKKLALSLNNGWQAGMVWMDQTAQRRSSPTSLWAQARSVIMLGLSYAPSSDPIADLTKTSAGNISVYARNRDYHDVIKGRLKELGGLMVRHGGAQVKVFVDTAPVMEKPLAQSAGLGWQGKHSVLVSRDHGSWLFLGAIFTDLDLPVDEEQTDRCGSCTRCLDICPTDAFAAPYQLDARKCLAYYNNEHRGPIPEKYRVAMGNRIFGCDDCLAVCPWNKFAQTSREAKLRARPELRLPDLGLLVQMNDGEFRSMFSGSPVKRLGHARFLRNVLIALGNSGNAGLLGHAIARLRDNNELIRGSAVWAARQLAGPEQFLDLREQHGVGEKSMQVAMEWRGARAGTQRTTEFRRQQNR
ncbi:MAG TPA: tRNA epoxyqueuosine(34) reductase QueG [Devosia sp.]|nr:tRNA epoxyqueuosine(34) reductase QueG [Devosia sp.]